VWTKRSAPMREANPEPVQVDCRGTPAGDASMVPMNAAGAGCACSCCRAVSFFCLAPAPGQRYQSPLQPRNCPWSGAAGFGHATAIYTLLMLLSALRWRSAGVLEVCGQNPLQPSTRSTRTFNSFVAGRSGIGSGAGPEQFRDCRNILTFPARRIPCLSGGNSCLHTLGVLPGACCRAFTIPPPGRELSGKCSCQFRRNPLLLLCTDGRQPGDPHP
jgi:hypothetical protein